MVSSRRRFIQTIGVGAGIGLAGCSSGGNGGSGNNQNTGTGGSGGTSGTTTGSGKPKRVQFHFLAEITNSNLKKTYQSTFDAWNKQLTGYEVKPIFDFVGINKSIPKLNTLLATGQPPDLVLSAPRISSFHKQLADMTPINDHVGTPKRFTQPVGGKQTVVPEVLEIDSKWYRQDVYDKAGVTPPTTWDEHLTVNQKLADYLPKKQYPELIQAGANSTVWNHMGPVHAMLGVNFIERTGSGLDQVRVSLGDTKNRQNEIKVLNYFKKLYQWSPDSLSYSWPDQTLVYVNDTVATNAYEGRLLTNVFAQKPKLAPVTKPTNFPRPPGVSKSDYKTFAINNPFAVPEGGQKDLSFNFLKWFYDSEYYKKVVLSVAPHQVPVDIKMLDSDAFKQNKIWSSGPGKTYKAYLKDIWGNVYNSQLGRTNPPTPYWGQVVTDSKIVPNMVSNALVGRKTPEKAVDDAVVQLKKKLPQVVKQVTS